jgi:cell division topological specificity factor
MGLFTDIYNTVAKFFRQSEEPVAGDASKAVATNRLKLVLMQDRTNLTPRVLEQMRSELVDLLSKYLEMDKELLELNFEQEGDQVALMLSIPVIRAKDEEEIEAALAAEVNEEVDDEDSDEETESEGVNVGENEETDETVAEENSEEAPKPRKRRSKKVTPPEELESKSEETECESQEFNENQAENEVACEHTEG